jgi:hypothetical protein
MNQISAADNHIIHATHGRWRLLQGERPLAEATPQGLRYGSRFAATRRLASNGILDREDISQVVLGWQHTDEAWHLGLILAPALANERGSRWVELIYWPDPDINVFEDLAKQCGQLLANALDLPFYAIPPQPYVPTTPERVLPELPLSFGDWTMKRASADKRQFVLERSQSWLTRKYSRVFWNILWLAIYLAVSLGTIFADIALPNTGTLMPNPQWLPYIGLATGVLLVCIILYHIWEIMRLPNRFFINGTDGTVSAWKNNALRWQVGVYDIQSLYVSEAVDKDEAPPATKYGELNLHLGGGDFKFLVSHPEPEDNTNIDHPFGKITRSDDAIRELNRENAHTNLQIAAVFIAEALGGIALWYDLRVDRRFGR